MTGVLSILNVGAGDTKISFDPTKPEETKRASAIIADMLQRGFAILVEVGKKDGKPLYQRAEAFDPETAEYIVVGLPPGAESPPGDSRMGPNAKARPGRPRGRPPKHRLKAETTNAVAVARTAGG